MRSAALILLVASGCAYRLGPPQVAHGDPDPVPLVQPSTDTRRWYVPVETDSLGPWLFFVDTGYTFSTCDDGLVEALGLPTKGKVHIRGEIGKVHATKAVLPPLELGGHEVTGLVCQVRDLGTTSSIDDPDEVPIAGVIGMDVLREFRVVFEPETGLVHLRDPKTAEPLERGAPGVSSLRRTTPLFGKRARLELQLDGTRQWPILDTGATNTYVDGARQGLDPAYQLEGVTVRGTGENGASVRSVSYYEIEDIVVGGLATAPSTLMDRDRPWWESGLLGLDLLSRFRQEYDFRRGRARLTPSPARALPQWAEWTASAPAAGAAHIRNNHDDAVSDPDEATP